MLTYLSLKLPRNVEVTEEASKTFLAALKDINYVNPFLRIFGKKPLVLSLEIILRESQIKFFLTCDELIAPFIETQVKANYPLCVIEKAKQDPLEDFTDVKIAYMTLAKGNYYPISTYEDFKETDPMSTMLSVLSKVSEKEKAAIQIILESVHDSWHQQLEKYASQGEKNPDGTYKPRYDASVILEKIKEPGFNVSIKLAAQTKETLTGLVSAIGVYTKAGGNSLRASYPNFLTKKRALKKFISRRSTKSIILNIKEIASIWHLPSDKVKVEGIAWGRNVLSEPPENLPVAVNMTEEEKATTNFFAKTQFRNSEVIFGIKERDRLRHIWALGKTGTGKSTMLENMAIDDIRKDRGVAFIDPHGDSCEHLLEFVPKHRINDVVYFNPADREYPISINPLEVKTKEEAELVVSGLMAVFTKIWANVWSARMEYILRNSFMTLTEIPEATFQDVLRLLADKSYRDKILAKVKDQAILKFWEHEYNPLPEKLQKEAIAPIQNKVGQFVTSPLIRRIVSVPKSTISLDEIMDKKKIMIANLSQGKLGEDNAAMLGAMLITKFQQSAMRRIDRPKEERTPFYLYVDEFQNFATSSFIKILSEARKFGLGLTLANQFMAQIPPEIQKAILGNAGTLICFNIGAEDAAIVNKEFAEVFSQNDLVNLPNHTIAIKLMIDGQVSRPFMANTLPLPSNKNQNKEKIIRNSRERYARKAKQENELPPVFESPTNQNQTPKNLPPQKHLESLPNPVKGDYSLMSPHTNFLLGSDDKGSFLLGGDNLASNSLHQTQNQNQNQQSQNTPDLENFPAEKHFSESKNILQPAKSPNMPNTQTPARPQNQPKEEEIEYTNTPEELQRIQEMQRQIELLKKQKSST